MTPQEIEFVTILKSVELTYDEKYAYLQEVMKRDDVIAFIAKKINWEDQKAAEDILKYGSLSKQVKKAIKTPEDFKNALAAFP